VVRLDTQILVEQDWLPAPTCTTSSYHPSHIHLLCTPLPHHSQPAGQASDVPLDALPSTQANCSAFSSHNRKDGIIMKLRLYPTVYLPIRTVATISPSLQPFGSNHRYTLITYLDSITAITAAHSLFGVNPLPPIRYHCLPLSPYRLSPNPSPLSYPPSPPPLNFVEGEEG